MKETPVVVTAEDMRLYREQDDSELHCVGMWSLLWFISFHPCSFVCPGSYIGPITVMREYLLRSGGGDRRWQSSITPALSETTFHNKCNLSMHCLKLPSWKHTPLLRWKLSHRWNVAPLATGALHHKFVTAQMSMAFWVEHLTTIWVLYYIACEEQPMTQSSIFLRSSLVCLRGMRRTACFCEHRMNRQQQAVFLLTNLLICFPGKPRPTKLCPAAFSPAHQSLSSSTLT